MKIIVAGALAATAFASIALAQSPPAILTDFQGKTLYVFDRDTSGKSSCNDQCARSWPPHFAAPDATASGVWSVITRDDGQKQWSYKGKPLYSYANDKKAGDTTGDGVNNVWHIAHP